MKSKIIRIKGKIINAVGTKPTTELMNELGIPRNWKDHTTLKMRGQSWADRNEYLSQRERNKISEWKLLIQRQTKVIQH